jgi:hypothetical protein
MCVSNALTQFVVSYTTRLAVPDSVVTITILSDREMQHLRFEESQGGAAARNSVN